jgi:hypothetical protein
MSNVYDKVLKETFKELFDVLSSVVLKLDVKLVEALSQKLQMTLEREPDLVFKVRDRQGAEFIVHIELQSSNDAKMLGRMFLYHALLWHIYKLPVLQYVLYIGHQEVKMQNTLNHFDLSYKYNLLDMKTIPCEAFLSREQGEAVVLAVLCDTGNKDKTEFVHELLKRLWEIDNHSRLLFERHVKQAVVLSRLRGLNNIILEEMNIMPITINIEEDSLYKKGMQKGLEKGIEKGMQKGITMSLDAIAFLLEVKFGGDGLRLMNQIRTVKDMEKLEKIMGLLKNVQSLKELEGAFLKLKSH